MKVNLEELEAAQKFINKINNVKINLKDIEWYRNGKKLETNDADIERWRFIGLSNTTFIDFAKEKNGKLTLKVEKRAS